MSILLDQELLLRPQDTATTIWLPFQLEQAAEQLEIHFTYSPKTVEDRDLARHLLIEGAEKYGVPEVADGKDDVLEEFLPITNLVTIGLRSPDGFAGCAHRPAPDQLHRITEDSASPGFLPCPLKAGEWRIAVQVHSVFTPECHCQIRVETKERGIA